MNLGLFTTPTGDNLTVLEIYSHLSAHIENHFYLLPRMNETHYKGEERREVEEWEQER